MEHNPCPHVHAALSKIMVYFNYYSLFVSVYVISVSLVVKVIMEYNTLYEGQKVDTLRLSSEIDTWKDISGTGLKGNYVNAFPIIACVVGGIGAISYLPCRASLEHFQSLDSFRKASLFWVVSSGRINLVLCLTCFILDV